MTLIVTLRDAKSVGTDNAIGGIIKEREKKGEREESAHRSTIVYNGDTISLERTPIPRVS